jgi:signal transduction histidine kinase
MKVSTKISAAFGFLMVIVAALLLYHVRTIRESVSTSFELSEISSRLALSTTHQLGRLNQIEENARKYWVTRDLGYLDRFGETVHDYDAALRHLAALPLGAVEQREVEWLLSVWREFRPVAEQFMADARAQAFTPTAEPLPVLQAHLARLRQQTRRAGEASQAVMASRLERSAHTARRVERVSLGAAAAALLLSVLVSALAVRSISSALARLKAGTHAVAEGDFGYRLPVDRDDEFAELARDFNVMTHRLAELDRMKRDFLSKVSHDLKTPLASMQETTRALLDEVSGELTPTQRRLLLLSHQSGRRLSAMIADILDLSSLEAGAFQLAPARHDGAELARLAAAQMEAVAAERGVRLELELPATELAVDCDAERIVQVLTNLLDNAMKFSPPQGAIRLSAQRHDSRPAGVPAERWSSRSPTGGRACRRPSVSASSSASTRATPAARCAGAASGWACRSAARS